ncbi:QsdR family transcriptional regulator [Actinomadura bangladeshensis]|uniref:TetR/AcrR family transcriptional regulator n=1 Tax=Actinomadura bangladeshensis TaxID=453573 RepID=A0A6L9QUG0_9ACTN|nr:TetR/AcrR family transcriptional regulator [Actinomadura bangladeshensis]
MSDLGTPAAGRDGHPGRRRAIGLARAKFMAGERLDMQGLAGELGIDRTTLFRWVGNRDQLVVSAIVSITLPTLRRVIASAEGSGAEMIADVAERYARASIEADYFRKWLESDPERVLRLLTSKASPLQRNVVAAFEQLLEDQYPAASAGMPLPLPDLAYLIVRIVESFVFSDLIAGNDPDWTKVGPAVAALLRPR